MEGHLQEMKGFSIQFLIPISKPLYLISLPTKQQLHCTCEEQKQMDVEEGTDRQSEQQSDRGDIQQQLVTVLGWRADKHESLLDLVVFTLPVSNYNQLKIQCFSVYSEFYKR